MAVTEKSALLRKKDTNGESCIVYPITKKDNVDGLDEAIDEAKIIAKGVATAGDGAAYTATVPGITALEAGVSFIMIPHTVSTAVSPTLNVNGLGAKTIRQRVSGFTGTTTPGKNTNWIASNKPVRVTYDGIFWVTDMTRPNANDIYGTIPSETIGYDNTNSGMAASNVQAAIDELSGAKVQAKTMTTAEYNALEAKSANTLYMLSDAEEETGSGGVQSDLAINDPTNPAYVKNRLCYEEDPVLTEIVPEETVAFSDAGEGLMIAAWPASMEVVDQATYVVKWDGVEYECVCYAQTDSTPTYIGNISLLGLEGGADEPFIIINSDDQWACASTEALAEHTISISKVVRTIRKLDEKYLPSISKLESHIQNSGIHVTEDDKTAWNSTISFREINVSLPVSADWYSVAYGNGKFVAVGYNGGYAAYSKDGLIWSQPKKSISNRWKSVAYGNGKFVAISGNNNRDVIYSEDGITWTKATTSLGYGNWISIAYGNGKFVAVAYQSNKTAYSEDGITWTRTANMPFANDWNSVAYGNGKFVAVGYNTSNVVYSEDGITWTRTGVGSTNFLRGVTYGNGKFVAVGTDGDGAYSEDGITWTKATTPSGNWNSVTYGNGKFVAVGYNGDTVIYSEDGITWSQSKLPVSADWYSVAYGNGKFVAVAYGPSNAAAYSEDGIIWINHLKRLETASGIDVTNQVKEVLGLT